MSEVNKPWVKLGVEDCVPISILLGLIQSDKNYSLGASGVDVTKNETDARDPSGLGPLGVGHWTVYGVDAAPQGLKGGPSPVHSPVAMLKMISRSRFGFLSLLGSGFRSS